jgi:hypothetical protein
MEWEFCDFPGDVCDVPGGDIKEIINKTIATDWCCGPQWTLVVEGQAADEQTVSAFAKAAPILEAGEDGDTASEQFSFVLVDL